MTSSASICSRMRITPIWLAISVPALAATIDAAMIGPSSRTPAIATNMPTSPWPPSGLKPSYPWIARLVPMNALITARMGRLCTPMR